jgi:hypothetical protein
VEKITTLHRYEVAVGVALAMVTVTVTGVLLNIGFGGYVLA